MAKAGDVIKIVNPTRNRAVNTGYVNLHFPDLLYTKIPYGIPDSGIKVIEDLIDWGILAVEEDIEESPEEDSIEQYESLTAQEAVAFLSGVESQQRDRFLKYEKATKNRKTVLRKYSA